MAGTARALRMLAKEYGVLPSRRDSAGSRHRADEETLAELLRLMGAHLERIDDAERALRERRTSRATRMIEPVIVLWDGAPARVELRLPVSRADERFTVLVERAGHDAVELDRSRCRVSAPRRDAPGFVAMIVDVPVQFEPDLHRLAVEAGGIRRHATVISAPSRISEPVAGEQRRWGVVAPLVRPARGRALAPRDLSSLARLGEWLGAEGGTVVGTTSLTARFGGFGAEPRDGTSLSLTRQFWHEDLVDLDAVPEAAEDLDVEGEGAPSGGDDGASRRHLARAARIAKDRPRREAALRSWLEENPRVLAYAAFRAAVERSGPGAPPGAPDPDDDLVRIHAYTQWVAEQQLRDLGEELRARRQALLGRFPMGVHPDGFDVTAEPGLFVAGARVAPAPGDETSDQELQYGFPPVDPNASREQGHRHFLACIEAHLRHFDVLTVERVSALHRQWWVPLGADPATGAFVQHPAEELHALLCLAASRRRSVIVGEEQGRMLHESGRALQQHRFYTIYDVREHLGLLHAEILSPPPRRTVAITGHPDAGATFAEIWHGLEPERRGVLLETLRGADLLGTTYGEVLEVTDVFDAIVELLGRSRSEIVMLSLEDLWIEREAEAIPGTSPHQRSGGAPGVVERVPVEALEPARRLLALLDAARRPGELHEVGVATPRVDQAT